ncbi:28S ribosomal protein S26, mitochondrial [Varanus komodoensis]|uniref:Small ribosomal subunit protein mS26 n=1 Tax=Varanus komodoensis TaxID=61221 RepID=A0A8D2LVI0_VARKO|nr:28S ribosomal protein S26, mitochondrial [Varanus komodoensis]KAF7252415.1 28S ribosomal protein S26, mitochondrial [Varanus komodoensis]
MLAGLLGRAALLPGRRCPAPLLVVPARGRKSRNDPPAKSKAGRLNVPPPVDPAELLVVTARYAQYRQVVREIRGEFRAEYRRKCYSERSGEVWKERQRATAEEHQRLMALNDAENKRLQELREERLRKEAILKKERRLQGAQNRAMLMEEFLKERESEVLQLQEEAKNFITPENLDQRIEECLNNPRSYNFAIDKEGRIAKRSVLP